MFKEYIKKIQEAVGSNRTAMIVSKSIYIVCSGSDDIANTYAETPFRRFKYDIPSYTDFMASEASKFLQVLYGNIKVCMLENLHACALANLYYLGL